LDINNTDKAKAYIKQHMSEQLSLRTLGKALRINNTQLLAQHFKQLNDISLYEFDRYYRMEAAFQRVTQTRFSIAFIAHIFGYKRTTAFSKAFGKYFGYSPSTLRKGKKGSR
jgi:YesN/AraC family two-component response regulator